MTAERRHAVETKSEYSETIEAHRATVGWIRTPVVRVVLRRHHSLRSASVTTSRDGLVVAGRLDTDRDLRIVAFSREIRDARGRVWTLREKRLSRAWTAAHLAAKTLARAARGWLLFEHGLRQIVVTPPPAHWQEWDERALVRLMEHHAPKRAVRRD